MTDERYDIIFCAELVAGTDQVVAQAQLKQSFGLSDTALRRLFDGRPVSIKRGVDAAVAARYRTLFREAGALVRIDPVAPVAPVAEVPEPDERAAPPVADEVSAQPSHARLSLSTETGYLEEPVDVPPPDFDLSYLSLEMSDDWSLEDCEPAPLPMPLPDISHLSIVNDEPQDSSRST